MTDDRKQIARCCTLVALLVLCAACSPGEPAGTAEAEQKPRLGREEIQKIYLRSCYSCHDRGVSGAPRTGDSAAWQPRLAKGMDTLVANAINGYRAMPPRGLCFDCSEAELAELIRYMANTQPE